MTREEFLNKKYSEYFNSHFWAHQKFFESPASGNCEPFKISDNIYYVGDKYVCIHMIDTGDGLVLIDSGYFNCEHILIDSIYKLGFNPRDVKWIIHSHAHYDHFGASSEFKKMYGTRLAISRVDFESVKEKPHRAHIDNTKFPYARIPEFDKTLEDGEVFELGNMKMRCVLTPGHTDGVMSFFWNTTWQGEEYVAATFGGAGVGAVTLPHLCYNERPYDTPQTMLRAIDSVIEEKVDFHLGNHPGNNNTFGRYEKMKKEGGNPFLNPLSWKTFLLELKKSVDEKIEENKALEDEMKKLGL